MDVEFVEVIIVLALLMEVLHILIIFVLCLLNYVTKKVIVVMENVMLERLVPIVHLIAHAVCFIQFLILSFSSTFNCYYESVQVFLLLLFDLLYF